ncbi:DUF3081 family protein [Salinibius halmophilus]|uniref:DUF3081 family protein n=1 Tax=Salinibius halmophilus TaxID=1853216 RepID=UPI000E675FF5|nr:DUF3081 family protein [Salinibius halmophilus]
MSKTLDFHTILTAAEIIRERGERNNDGAYRLDGVEFHSSIDGYSVTLKSQDVTLTVNFHNTYNIESPGKDAEEKFFKRLRQLVFEYSKS